MCTCFIVALLLLWERYVYRFYCCLGNILFIIYLPSRWSSGQHYPTTDHEVAGSITGTSTNFKFGLGLERGPPSLVRTIG